MNMTVEEAIREIEAGWLPEDPAYDAPSMRAVRVLVEHAKQTLQAAS